MYLTAHDSICCFSLGMVRDTRFDLKIRLSSNISTCRFLALGETQDLSLRLHRRLIFIAVVTQSIVGYGLSSNYFTADLSSIHRDSLQSRIATGLLRNVVSRRGLRSFLADLARVWLAMASRILNLRAAWRPRKLDVLLPRLSG